MIDDRRCFLSSVFHLLFSFLGFIQRQRWEQTSRLSPPSHLGTTAFVIQELIHKTFFFLISCFNTSDPLWNVCLFSFIFYFFLDLIPQQLSILLWRSWNFSTSNLLLLKENTEAKVLPEKPWINSDSLAFFSFLVADFSHNSFCIFLFPVCPN